jgi:hypothetical protein
MTPLHNSIPEIVRGESKGERQSKGRHIEKNSSRLREIMNGSAKKE